MIRIAQPLIGDEERAAVTAVLDSGQLAAGPVTKRLEERFAEEVSQTRHAVAVANGTAALHLALLALDVGRGDEVITTPFTFQATANMILATGARPLFADVGPDGNLDILAAEQEITGDVKAVLPVHLYGRLCDMDELSIVCARYGFHLIEDAAQAHGAAAMGKRAGGFGTAGCFSFYATKNMTSGEGGMITTDDDALAARLRRLRHHGQSDTYSSVELGFNYRTTDLTAAIALAQLDRLDEFTQKRRDNATYLSQHLKGVTLPPRPSEPESMVWHQYTIRTPGRDDLRAYLREREIESSVYYPTILPDQPLYKQRGFGGGDFPNARRIASEVLSLPVHPALSQDDLERIVTAVNEWASSREGSGTASK